MSKPQPALSRTALPAWQALRRHAEQLQSVSMRDLFESDPARFDRFSLTLDDMLLDYSKNRITDETLAHLQALAGQCDLPDWIERLFSGERINHTEQRAVLHTALRDPEAGPIRVDGEDVLPQVQAVLAQMRELSEAVRSRHWRGYSGQPITDVVNIGVGGSDLGPLMACEALRPYAIHDLRMHFVSNVDENHILDTLESIKPETTLFIIVSKSFTTRDTLVNAKTARNWFRRVAGDDSAMERHFIAVSDNVAAAGEFGIPESNIFRMWDWVGGRYSMWSAVGLSIAISVGMDHFESMLQGACDMDRHFRNAPLDQNMPVILGLLGIWYNNFLGTQTYAVLPYDQHLKYLPDYLRQMDMESNGKSVDRQGNPITDYETGPVLFGQLGITGQHAFYQLMHQGTKLIPADIIAPITSLHCIRDHHRTLMSNVFAQTEAFMRGKTEAEARTDMQAQGLDEAEIERLLPYRVFPGNKPTNTILFHTLDPRTLGRLIALYEHKVFVQGVIWDINSFDQWGVELGKQLADKILPELADNDPIDSHDTSTNGLINYYKGLRPDK
ncbi:glucose-6-phosphate isomerase [Thiohalophilus thiocyanatoxydans]|uniref:Glucose-6-phosphate isomerase n=1 Tax=Thiohalophilus thiocyanatoxydans TaxID=381308 RepID=A0A4R8IMQ1_9GAMM|nr:glucose-6-phosphate isomerase [Thiohalophilus thiocyanatoxydans]TDY01718.1 glucose-6-phosphate isomerase [Thiohalophilus thiocyanatoxydans]